MKIRSKPRPEAKKVINIFSTAKMRKQRNILFFIALIELVYIIVSKF